jgi:hypothetical protein
VANAVSQYQVTLSYSVRGGGNLQPPALQYVQGGKVVRTTLTTTPKVYSLDSGTFWNASTLLQGSNSTVRWPLLGNYYGTGSSEVRVLTYYRQSFVTFSYSYDGNGQIFPRNPVNYTAFGQSTLVYPTSSEWADFNTPYSYGNTSNYLPPNSRWYVLGQNGVINGPGTVTAVYFEQYQLSFSVTYLGPDNLVPTTLTNSYLGASVNHTITTTGGPYWVDYNSSFALRPTLYPESGAYRWFLHSMSDSVAVASSNVEAQYVEQFPISIQFGVSGGTEPSPPELTATISRQVTTLQLIPGTSVTWVDAEFGYQISNPLMGSTPDERWFTSVGTDGIANGPINLNLEYYHQVLVPLSYSIVGGGTVPSFDAGYMSFGSLVSIPVAMSPNNLWMDYGSPLGVPWTFAGSTQFERWELANPPSAPVTKAGPVALVYYHQYYVPFVYSFSGQGSPPSSVLSGFAFGVQYSWPLQSGTSTWLDGGSPWSVSAVLPSSLAGEQWAGVGALNGTVGLGTLIATTYQHEYLVSVTSNPSGGGALAGGGWAVAGETVSVTTTPNQGYSFEGWQGSGQGSYSGNRENYSVVALGPMQEVAQYFVALTIQISGSGSVTLSAGSYSYTVGNHFTFYVAPGTKITLVAKPGLLQAFRGWQGIPAGSAGAVAFTADAPLSVTAGFAIDQVQALGVVTLYFGFVVFAIIYIVSNRRPRSIFRRVRSYV